MKKLFLILMLISSEGWAIDCDKIQLVFEKRYKQDIYRCDLGNEICFYSWSVSNSISCFPKIKSNKL